VGNVLYKERRLLDVLSLTHQNFANFENFVKKQSSSRCLRDMFYLSQTSYK